MELRTLETNQFGTDTGVTAYPKILLDTDEGDVSQFMTNAIPREAEVIHNIPQQPRPTDEILFDEPDNSGEYPITPSVIDDFDSLDLTMKEFTGDVFSKPISLDTDEPLLGDVIQKAVPLEKPNLVKENTLGTAIATENKFNWWLLIIAAVVLLGVMYLSKNKL